MAHQNPGKDDLNDENGLIIAVGAIVLVIFLYWYIYTRLDSVVWFMLYMTKYMSYPLSFIPYYDGVIQSINHVKDVSKVPFGTAYEIAWKTMIVYSVPFLYFTYKFSKGVWVDSGLDEIYSKRHTMASLVDHNSRMFPWLAPVVNREGSILDEPLDKGAWATVRSPIQWAAQHELILDENKNPIRNDWLINPKTGLYDENSPLITDQENSEYKDIHLDYDKAVDLLMDQLGSGLTVPTTVKQFEALPDYHQGLIAAFLAYGVAEKKKGLNLFNQMSLSFKEGDWIEEEGRAENYSININGAKELFEQYMDNPDYKRITKLHSSFYYPFMIAMIEFARSKGVLEGSKFIWLRPTERLLWYCLNEEGGYTGWIEALGPWTHYTFEKYFKSTIWDGRYSCNEAVKHVDWHLSETGWYTKTKHKNKSAEVKEDVRKTTENDARRGTYSRGGSRKG